MPSNSRPRRPFGLISAFLAALGLTAAATPPALAEVPTSLQERAAEILLPGVLDADDDPAAAPADDATLDEGAGEGEDDSEIGDAFGLGDHEDAHDDAHGDDEHDEHEHEHEIDDDDDDAPAPARSRSRSRASSKGGSSRSKSQAKAPPRPKGAAECGYRSPLHEHEVAKGETLGAIAGRYGVRRADILALNKVKDPNLIRPGQKLKVCPEIAPKIRKSIEVEVKKGESLIKIAERHGLSVKELVALQPTKVRDRLTRSPKALQIGQKLVVMIEVAPAYAAATDDGKALAAAAVVQLPNHRAYYHVKRPNLAYGTATTVKAIQAAISRYKQKRPRGPRVHVGDISRRGGGPLRGHRSHQKGVDVDIGLVHKGILAGETKFVDANPQTLDVARTWALVKAFADTRAVRAIFLDYGVQKTLYEHARRQGVSEDTLDELFQYPRGKGHSHGLIRHWKGHKNHFHVRFHH